ncbi:hypothetical protein [Paeniglutamicibacter terrestris]|uniref:hypothetical protein n=1 Tax=Paeniglutamicibacter terrestris TaxID=2723403 RepID=UPI001FD90B83|nr:hypothetical protein [Paeniglutamicibacter terrestris]
MASHAVPPLAPFPSRSARMKPGHWVLLVLGVLLAVLGLGLTVGGAVTLGANAAQRDGRYLVGDTENYRSTGYALTSPSVVLDAGSENMSALPPLGDLASIHVRVTNAVPDTEVFVGIADVSDIDVYLQDVARSSLGTPRSQLPTHGRGARRGRRTPRGRRRGTGSQNPRGNRISGESRPLGLVPKRSRGT